MLDQLFLKNIKHLFPPVALHEELEPINTEMVSISHLSGVSCQQSEMENYLYLCWIQLWAMTLWYQDNQEKKYLFQQLLKVLDKVRNHEIETFNLLFESVSKYGEDYMIIKLYERLLNYRLNPSYHICSTVVKLIDRKDMTKFSNIINITEKVFILVYKV